MTAPTPKAVSGFDKAETFTNNVEFETFIRRFIPLLIMLFVVGALMVAFILSFAKLGPAIAWGIAVPASAAMCTLLYSIKKRQFAATTKKATLEFSPFGAVLHEPHVRIELPWPGIRRIGDAQTMAPLRVIVANEGLAKVAYAVAAASMQRKEEGLIGAGGLVLAQNAPALLRQQIEQNDRGVAAEPGTGQPCARSC